MTAGEPDPLEKPDRTSGPTVVPFTPAGESGADGGPQVTFPPEAPLPLDCGVELAPFTIAYRTYGKLNASRSNAILICHALTGDQHVANEHPITGKPGWWIGMVGPGRVFDADRYFIICSNVIGGCMGSTGPATVDPATGEPFGLNFPVITIADMVRAQRRLVDHLGIEKLFCVTGGSMGAMQALQWAVSYPDHVFSCLPIAGSWRHSAQNIAFHEVGRQAILADPDWAAGNYGRDAAQGGRKPTRGLAVARMAAHITYLSEAALHRKFGRNLQDRHSITYGFEADFQVESYLRHQGSTFVDRFDANSYLFITRAMDYFDLAAEHDGRLAPAFEGTGVRFGLISFTSDWLFPTDECRTIVRALHQVGADVGFAEIETDKGHDAFLLDEPEFRRVTQGFLNGWAHAAGLITAASPEASLSDAGNPATVADRPDLDIVEEMVGRHARVLDVGCGDGTLLTRLVASRAIDPHGLERDLEEVHAASARGIPVVQGDANLDLEHYADESFDLVILSKTLQQLERPHDALAHLLRIGRQAIVSLNNFGHWRARAALAFQGRVPDQRGQTAPWWASPNIHICTLSDFTALVDSLDCRIERGVALGPMGRRWTFSRPGLLSNLLAEQAIFLLHRRGNGGGSA